MARASWRFREWILPDLPEDDIVSLGEGASPLTTAPRLSEELGIELLTKQCGHTLSGSFKDLGMTVLVSQVNHLRKSGKEIPAVMRLNGRYISRACGLRRCGRHPNPRPSSIR